MIFNDIKNYPFKTGQARIEVKISGDQIYSIVRNVYAPESWQREERNRMDQKDLINEEPSFLMDKENLKILTSTIEVRNKNISNTIPEIKKESKKRSWNDLTDLEKEQIVEYRKRKILEQKIDSKASLTKEYFKEILADSLKD